MSLDKERLSQQKNLEEIQKKVKATNMLTVYFSSSDDQSNHGLFPALVPITKKEDALSSIDWNFTYEGGLPSSCVYYDNDKELPTYERYGNGEGIEPLVVVRSFHGVREDDIELSEEFRHFHNLYHDKNSNEYWKFEDDGTEHKIAIIELNKIQIRLKEIKQFIAIKEMYLMLQFDYREFSNQTLEELSLKQGHQQVQEDLASHGLAYSEMNMFEVNAFSRLLGKVLIEPWSKSKSGLYGFSKPAEKKYLDFIIDLDDDGEEAIHNSNPGSLANNFGANPNSPHYLTPVYFNKQVLDRYYNQPSKYSVEDSYIRCGSLWGVQIDNHHIDKVCVWLGDLGRDIPYNDQLHWRSYNIPPTGKVSETYFKRQIMAQFTDSERPEHIFKTKYLELNKLCRSNLSWQLLLPLTEHDKHHFDNIRIPSTNEQKDFDELVLSLTKLLIDSLNEKKLNTLIPQEKLALIKGSISKVDEAFKMFNINNHEKHIDFLRQLQSLRSASSAHRKGSKYNKISRVFGIDNSSLQSVLLGILTNAIEFLSYLNNAVKKISVDNQ